MPQRPRSGRARGDPHRDHQGVRRSDEAEDEEQVLPATQPAAAVEQQQARRHGRAQHLRV